MMRTLRRSRTTQGGIRRCAAIPALDALINPIAVIPAKAGIQWLSPLTECKVAGYRISLRDCVCRIVNTNAEGGA